MSRLSMQKEGRLMKYFVAGVIARTAAELLGVNPEASCPATSYTVKLKQMKAISAGLEKVNEEDEKKE